jgi:hypothetical protein
VPTREASCSCGQLRLVVEGEPVRVSVCHCLECQKRTGSAFGVQARFARDQVKGIAGRHETFERVGDSGNAARFHFCPQCGATLFWEIGTLPAFIAIAVGNFAYRSCPAPTYSVYEARRHRWVDVPRGREVRHLE